MSRITIIILILMTYCSTVQGKTKSFRIYSTMGSLSVKINGVQQTVEGEEVQFQTHYPQLDSLYFVEDDPTIKRDYVLCNFKPDSIYVFFQNCCGSVDITKLSLYEQLTKIPSPDESQEAHEQYLAVQQLILQDRPEITLRIKNSNDQDTIYGMYIDQACFPTFSRMTKKGWNMGSPQKCFYWNNISSFIFFTSASNYGLSANKAGEIQDIYPSEKDTILQQVDLRIFDDEKVEITYDAKRDSIRVRRFAKRKPKTIYHNKCGC
ncbi:MAG: hypothetical protein IPP69_16295 [Flavobacteriales bacterium]|nr:hypothetical protein [Flavobacteriales bacterium]